MGSEKVQKEKILGLQKIRRPRMVVSLGARVLFRLFCGNFASLFLFYVFMCVIFIGTIYIYKYGLFLNGVQRTKINLFLKEIMVLLH